MQTLVEIKFATYFQPLQNVINLNTLLFKRHKLQQISVGNNIQDAIKSNCRGVIWNKIKSINVTD